MSETAERLVRRIEAIDTVAANNVLRAESYRQMIEEMKAVEGTATSPDNAVTVVAAPGGTIKSVTFTAAVRGVDPAALSASVLHTIAQAQARAAQAQAEVVRRGLGDTELLDRVLAEGEQLFGDQRPTDPGPAPVTAPFLDQRRAASEDADAIFEDDFDLLDDSERR